MDHSNSIDADAGVAPGMIFLPRNIVTFVSGNPDKRNDAIAILSPYTDIKLVDLDLKEIQGDEKEIAKDKCDLAMKLFENEIVIVEDTSLRFTEFGGMPGPYIKHFNKTVGADGLYKMLFCYSDKSAIVRSTVAIGVPKHLTNDGLRQIHIVSNNLKGEIVEPRGENGDKNGWDPCFKPAETFLTLGEMDEKERRKYCSRVGALFQATKVLLNIFNQNMDASKNEENGSGIELNN
uniref:Ham1-like protein n=1 Tax=Panagrolaimus sp. ES5 TaxID=591445 RepID=A0AC34F994_9BILA